MAHRIEPGSGGHLRGRHPHRDDGGAADHAGVGPARPVAREQGLGLSIRAHRADRGGPDVEEIPRGTLFVNVLPWAEVWLDGEKIGDTPIGNLSVPVGRHELLVRHPELGQQRRTITVNPGTPVRVGLDLRK
jgi:hypothetical protein